MLADWAASLLNGGIPAGLAAMMGLGLITAFNPCMLAMAPAAAGYVGGHSGISRQGLLLPAVCVLGYAGTLAALGLVAGAFGRAMLPSGGWNHALGLIYLVLGVYLLLGRRRVKSISRRWVGFYYSPVLYRLDAVMGRGTVLGALTLGAAFSLTPSPCATPVVLAILGTIAVTGGVWHGMLLLFAFGIGHSLLLFVFSALSGIVRNRWAGWTRWINPIFGLAMAALGVYLLLGPGLLPPSTGIHVH